MNEYQKYRQFQNKIWNGLTHIEEAERFAKEHDLDISKYDMRISIECLENIDHNIEKKIHEGEIADDRNNN